MDYSDYQLVKTLENMATKAGFVLARSNYGSEHLCLMTEKDKTYLPVYARNISLFTGTVEECVCFLQGWFKQQEYMTVLFRYKEGTIEKKEADLVTKLHADRIFTKLKEDRDIGYMTPKEDDPLHAPF
jgi:hypothetical protein